MKTVKILDSSIIVGHFELEADGGLQDSRDKNRTEPKDRAALIHLKSDLRLFDMKAESLALRFWLKILPPASDKVRRSL